MGILSQVAKRIKAYHGSENFNPQLAGRHPSDNADMSALQLVPHMAKGLINDVVKYGSQAATGEISDGDFLQQQPLTGQAKTIADAAGSAMGTALNYKVPSLLRGSRSAMDDIQMVVDAYQGVRPGIVDAIGEPNVNRGEGAALLGSMFIPAKIPKAQSGGLFSQAVIASDKLQRKTGNADGFFNDLTGKGQVKPDELNAMGFKEHFAGRNDVSRDEVRQFINDNQVQIKETVLGDAPNLSDAQLAEWAEQNFYNGHVDLIYAQTPRERKRALTYIEDIYKQEAVADSKFGAYTLEGGDNYRELLMSLPRKAHPDQGKLDDLIKSQVNDDYYPELENELIEIRKQREALKGEYADLKDSRNEYGLLDEGVRERVKEIKVENSKLGMEELKISADIKDAEDALAGKIYDLDGKIRRENPEFVESHHFNEPNILAHVRMKDRVDTDGNKTLLLEEVQSDWHQTGGEKGYALTPKKRKALDKEAMDLRLEFDTLIVKNSEKGLVDFNNPTNPVMGEDSKRALLLKTRLDKVLEQTNTGIRSVPDAPFKTDDKSSWYNLALKRGLLEAVEGGYDKLALTTGRQQADRYDLSKQISEVRLGGNEQSGFTVSAFDNNDNPVIMESIDSLDALPNLIGKDAAKSLVDQPLTDTASGSARILAGQDLSVGGEGMKQFYDRTLPNALGKLVKQDGVKVGESELLGKTPSKTEIASASDREEIFRLRDEIYNGDDTSATHDRYNELLAMYQPKPRTDTVHSIDITPKMRERVKKGLPMFATGGAAIGLGELMRQQQQEKEAGSGLLHSL